MIRNSCVTEPPPSHIWTMSIQESKRLVLYVENIWSPHFASIVFFVLSFLATLNSVLLLFTPFKWKYRERRMYGKVSVCAENGIHGYCWATQQACARTHTEEVVNFKVDLLHGSQIIFFLCTYVKFDLMTACLHVCKVFLFDFRIVNSHTKKNPTTMAEPKFTHCVSVVCITLCREWNDKKKNARA